MGTWRIVVEGQGIHHNGREDDADQIARKMLALLRDSCRATLYKAEFQLTDGLFRNTHSTEDLL